MDIDYKLFQNDDQKIVIATDCYDNENTNGDNSGQILNQSREFIDGDIKDTNEIMIFLTEAIPKSSVDFQDFLFSKFDFIKKLIDVDIINTQDIELKLILQMINMIISLQLFRSKYPDLDSIYNFCIITVKILIHDYKDDETSINIQLLLDCIEILINENNFSKLNEPFFNETRTICFLNDEISICCSKIIKKMSIYVPAIHDFQYFFNFFKYMCNNINPTIAYYLYSTLFNIIKNYPNIVKIPDNEQKLILSNKPHSLPQFWVYEMILNSYRYEYDIQSVAFNICSILSKDTICILEDSNIKNNILQSLKKSEDDKRTISAIHALKNFLTVDPQNYATYFTTDNITSITPFLINHILNSSYNVKEEASYLLSFAMQCAPKFFAKGFIEPYSSSLSINCALQFEEDAIISILGYDKTDLLINLLNGLLKIANECLEWGVIDELFEKFNKQIIPFIIDMKSDADEQVSILIDNLIQLLIPQSNENEETE